MNSTFDKSIRVAPIRLKRLPALSLSLALTIMIVQNAAWADSEPSSIKKISLNSDNQIVVEFSVQPDSVLTSPTLEDVPGPNHKLVLDFPDAAIVKGKTQPASQTLKELAKSFPDIKGIRYAALTNAEKPTARVVLDLPESFSDNPQVVKVGADSVIISLVGAPGKDISATPTPPVIAATPDGAIPDSARIQPEDVSATKSNTMTPPSVIPQSQQQSSVSAYGRNQTDLSTNSVREPKDLSKKLELPTGSAYDQSSMLPTASASSDLTSPYPAATAKESPVRGTAASQSPSVGTTVASLSEPSVGGATRAPSSESQAATTELSNKQLAVHHYNDAVKLHLSGKLAAAISEYQEAIKANPNLSEAHSNLGLIYNQQHNYAQALSELRKALAINPKDAITYNGVGAALRAQKDLTGAIKNWQTAISLDPKLATAHYNLGTAYEIQKDFDKALDCYKQAVKNDYRLGEAYYRMGLILQKKNNTEEAVEAFNKALQASAKADYREDVRQRIAVIEKKKESTSPASH
jgi:tetratricopeptide (TPR) repeat protein